MSIAAVLAGVVLCAAPPTDDGSSTVTPTPPASEPAPPVTEKQVVVKEESVQMTWAASVTIKFANPQRLKLGDVSASCSPADEVAQLDRRYRMEKTGETAYRLYGATVGRYRCILSSTEAIRLPAFSVGSPCMGDDCVVWNETITLKPARLPPASPSILVFVWRHPDGTCRTPAGTSCDKGVAGKFTWKNDGKLPGVEVQVVNGEIDLVKNNISLNGEYSFTPTERKKYRRKQGSLDSDAGDPLHWGAEGRIYLDIESVDSRVIVRPFSKTCTDRKRSLRFFVAEIAPATRDDLQAKLGLECALMSCAEDTTIDLTTLLSNRTQARIDLSEIKDGTNHSISVNFTVGDDCPIIGGVPAKKPKKQEQVALTPGAYKAKFSDSALFWQASLLDPTRPLTTRSTEGYLTLEGGETTIAVSANSERCILPGFRSNSAKVASIRLKAGDSDSLQLEDVRPDFLDRAAFVFPLQLHTTPTPNAAEPNQELEQVHAELVRIAASKASALQTPEFRKARLQELADTTQRLEASVLGGRNPEDTLRLLTFATAINLELALDARSPTPPADEVTRAPFYRSARNAFRLWRLLASRCLSPSTNDKLRCSELRLLSSAADQLVACAYPKLEPKLPKRPSLSAKGAAGEMISSNDLNWVFTCELQTPSTPVLE